jgi:PAS domain S-box-containing protein
MKIKQKLIILLLLMALAPTLLVSVMSYITMSRQVTSQTSNQLQSIAIKQQQKIAAFIQNEHETLSNLALNFDLRSALQRYIEQGDSASLAVARTTLKDRLASLSTAQSLSLVDTDGTVLASTTKTTEGQKLPSGIISVGTGGQSSVKIQEDNEGIVKLFVVTEIAIAGHDTTLLLGKYNVRDVSTTIDDYTGLGSTGETILVTKDSDGHVVPLFPLRFDPNGAFRTRMDALQPFVNTAGVVASVADYRGKQVIAAHQQVDDNLVLVAKMDQNEAFASIALLRNRLLAIVALSSLAIVLVALYFTRVFTMPIILLTNTTRRIMQGDFTQRTAIKSTDEIGVLAANFDTMTTRLAALYQSLEQKVQERTQALDQKVRELASAKAKDEAILDSIGDGMIVTDSTGNVLLINDIAAGFFAVDAQQMLHKPVDSISLFDEQDQPVGPADRPAHMALQTGRKTIQDVKVHGNDGTRMALNIMATPIVETGTTIGVIQTIRDVTKEREVDRMKTEFISLASHQLRTPLSAIKWFSEMLGGGDAGELNKEQQDFVKNIMDSSERMIDLVNSLLNISRIESGRIIVEPKPTDLKQLVDGIVSDLKAKTAERQQTLIVSVHDGLPKVNLDPHLIGQVYLNLLSNAIKYTPKGGQITVIVSRKDDFLLSSVSDNGYGIPKAQQSRMFQKFFRAENIVKIESDGTGLGMYLVKAIIESSGGKIWFESEENKGTTFWFTLPMSGMKAKAGEVTLGS